jgi:hypothetical protein
MMYFFAPPPLDAPPQDIDPRRRFQPPREGLMANKSQGTWYVSFELPRGKRALARATETFPNEREAKKFARAKLIDTPNLCRHAQSSSAETDDSLKADSTMARTNGRAGCTQVTVRTGASRSWRAIGEEQMLHLFRRTLPPVRLTRSLLDPIGKRV